MHSSGLQLRSLITSNAELELSLVEVPVPTPEANEVIIRVEAAPLNPSDMGLLFGPADLSSGKTSGSAAATVTCFSVPERAIKAVQGRVDKSLTVGNEGAGTVVAAGDSPAAQALLGKTVATFAGGMYAQFRCVRAEQCVALPPGCTAAEGASIFVNPMTAVCMLDVLRREGHKALVHTAAASNLGQMLNRLCLAEGVDLVNIVRNPSQVDLLRSQGAKYVCDSSAPTFVADLNQALIDTAATLAFDAIGGGSLASQILSAMESAISRSASQYNRYGSATLKQVYIYGALDLSPTILKRNFGPAFAVSGWLLPNYLQKVGAEAQGQFQQKVLAGLQSVFACQYAREVSLAEALQLEAIAAYSRPSTGGKYLINPTK